MTAISLRVFAAIAGVLLGLGGFIIACQGLTFALIDALGPVAGLFATAGILVLLAVIAFWVVLRPSPHAAAEVEEAKAAAGKAVAGLPAEAISALIRKHPVKLILAALMLGYTLIKDPKRAVQQLQTFVIGLI